MYIRTLFYKTQIINTNMAAVYNDANFESEVLKSELLTIVDFWAPWCGPCKAIGPTIDALSTEYAGKVNVGKVNVDENPNVSMEFGITSIPCVLYFKNGKVVDKQVGAAPKAAYVKKIENNI